MTYCRKCYNKISTNESDIYDGYCSTCYKKVKKQNSKNNLSNSPISAGFLIYLICATVILYLLAFKNGIELETGTRIIMLLFMMCPFVFLPLYMQIAQYNTEVEYNQEQERIKNLSDAEKQEYYYQRQQEQLDNTIDYTIIVAEDSKKSLGSAVARGAIGGALLGPVGLVGGAISGKNKSETTFTVVYKSGRRELITVNNDSTEFEEYATYVK